MASRAASSTILFGFTAAFCCLNLLAETATGIHSSRSPVARLEAAVLLAAVVATCGLTLLLLFAYVRALDAGRRFSGRFASATLLAATATLLAGAAVRLIVVSEYPWWRR